MKEPRDVNVVTVARRTDAGGEEGKGRGEVKNERSSGDKEHSSGSEVQRSGKMQLFALQLHCERQERASTGELTQWVEEG